MSKKNRVTKTVIVHLTENGSYKVGVIQGEKRRQMHDLNWSQVRAALDEVRRPASAADAKSEGDKHLALIKAALSATPAGLWQFHQTPQSSNPTPTMQATKNEFVPARLAALVWLLDSLGTVPSKS
ncbi:hypothetical protein [Massilia sp. TN1-12]|uniref:hypothetical protein n=1 Tax=Massilia paldalensis TaxID=3377675 RepID=UPI0038501408